MNTQKLYALARAYEDIGFTPDAAFERAFLEYKSIKEMK